MRRAGLHFSAIVARLTFISACGGPTTPSKAPDTSPPPRAPSGAQGTIALLSAAPKVYTTSFPAGASSSAAGARLGIGVSAPYNGQAAPHAKLECVATNVRGETARKSTDIGRAPQ